MDHVEVLVRLLEKQDAGMTEAELREATRLEPKALEGALKDLVRGELARFDAASRIYRSSFRSDEERAAVKGLVQLYHQRPVPLVKLIYAMPSLAISSFADAFRLRKDES